MTAARRLVSWLACAALLAGVGSAVAQAPAAVAPAGATHEVRRGDTLFGIARRTKYDGVSRNQMILGIFRANEAVFPGGNLNILEVGTILNIPSRDRVAAIDSAEADRTVRELLAPRPVAAASAPQLASAKPSAVPARPVAPVPAGQQEAARRYDEGHALEHKGDHQGAFNAYLAAAEAGYGPAQRRLGEIYDKGSPAVKRDYQTSLRWYQKARDQGVQIPKPIQRILPK